jgi:hypothetical protein
MFRWLRFRKLFSHAPKSRTEDRPEKGSASVEMLVHFSLVPPINPLRVMRMVLPGLRLLQEY